MDFRSKRIAALLLLAATLGCAGSIQPITATDLIGDAPAIRSAFLVKQEIVVPVSISPDYVLLPGEYKPELTDRHGIFYAAPSGVVQRTEKGVRTYRGGIHFPNQPDRYYTFPSLWVDLPAFGTTKYPLPDSVRTTTWGTHIVFMYDGEPVQ